MMSEPDDNPYANRDHESPGASVTEADVLAAAGLFNMVGGQLTGVDKAKIGDDGKKAQRLDPSAITNLQSQTPVPAQLPAQLPAEQTPSNFPVRTETSAGSPVRSISEPAPSSPPVYTPRESATLPEEQLKKIVRLLVQKMNTLQSTVDRISGALQSIVDKVPDNPKHVSITLEFPEEQSESKDNEQFLDDLDRSVLDEATD